MGTLTLEDKADYFLESDSDQKVQNLDINQMIYILTNIASKCDTGDKNNIIAMALSLKEAANNKKIDDMSITLSDKGKIVISVAKNEEWGEFDNIQLSNKGKDYLEDIAENGEDFDKIDMQDARIEHSSFSKRAALNGSSKFIKLLELSEETLKLKEEANGNIDEINNYMGKYR